MRERDKLILRDVQRQERQRICGTHESRGETEGYEMYSERKRETGLFEMEKRKETNMRFEREREKKNRETGDL